MAKKPAKPKPLDVLKEDVASLTDRVDALAARVAFLETFRPSIEVVRDGAKPVSLWWRWFFGDGT